MIDFLRPLKLPIVLLAIVASLWAYARAQNLGVKAQQTYWPAMGSNVANASGADCWSDDSEVSSAQADIEPELKKYQVEIDWPLKQHDQGQDTTPADSSQTR